jgi:hypothetical protein
LGPKCAKSGSRAWGSQSAARASFRSGGVFVIGLDTGIDLLVLACKSMTDQAETAIAYLATRFNRCSNLPSHLAHSRGSLGDEGMRKDYSKSGGWYCADQRQCYSLSLARQAAIRQLNNRQSRRLQFVAGEDQAEGA